MKPVLAKFLSTLTQNYQFINAGQCAFLLKNCDCLSQTEFEIIIMLSQAGSLAPKEQQQSAADAMCMLVSHHNILVLEKFVDALYSTRNTAIADAISGKIREDAEIDEKLGLNRIWRTDIICENFKEPICAVLHQEKISVATLLDEKFTGQQVQQYFPQKNLQYAVARLILDMRHEEEHLEVARRLVLNENPTSSVTLLLPSNIRDPPSRVAEGYSTLEDIETRTPLFQVVRFIQSGNLRSAIDSKSNTGRTPVLEAAANGHVEVVLLLVQKGASLETRSSNPEDFEDTAAHMAARNGHIEVVRLALNKKPALIHTRNGLGQTPLHRAAAEGHLAISRLILGRGASVTEKDNNGQTPITLAKAAGNKNEAPAVVKLLESKKSIKKRR